MIIICVLCYLLLLSCATGSATTLSYQFLNRQRLLGNARRGYKFSNCEKHKPERKGEPRTDNTKRNDRRIPEWRKTRGEKSKIVVTSFSEGSKLAKELRQHPRYQPLVKNLATQAHPPHTFSRSFGPSTTSAKALLRKASPFGPTS